MKRYLIILIAIQFAILTGAQNLLNNGNFEIWTDQTASLPDNWVRGAGTVGTHYLFATDATRGNVLRLTDPTTAASKRFSNDADISINQAGTYKATFYVKGTVRLRYVALVQGSANPTNTGATVGVTNHFTNITYNVENTDWTQITTDIEVPSTANFTAAYRFHIVWSSTTAANTSDFMIDDVTLTKITATSNNANLSTITITPQNFPTANPPADFDMGGFNSSTLDYTFTSSYHNVPIVGAVTEDVTAITTIIQATSFTGTEAERTATIVVTSSDGTSTKTYTVKMEKHPGFISGITWNANITADDIEWADLNGMFLRSNGKNHGDFWAVGNTSMRCNSNEPTGYYAITPQLANGAEDLTFYVINYNSVVDNSAISIKKSTNGADWTEIHRINPTNNDWEQVSVKIHDNSPTLQVRFEFEKTITVAGEINIDDILITPYDITSEVEKNSLSKEVFGGNGRLFFTPEASGEFKIYNLSGVELKRGIVEKDLTVLMQRGVYLIQLNSETYKVVL